MSLKSLWSEWLNLWAEMESWELSHITVSAPFFSVPPNAGSASKRPVILYVGKATHKDWWLWRFLDTRFQPAKERIDERFETTREFLDKHLEFQTSAFWKLYRRVGVVTGGLVVWTNVAKIGVRRPRGETRSINPWGKFKERQEDLALRTLCAEITEYKPELVVMLTRGDRAYDFAAELFRGWGQPRQEVYDGGALEFLMPSDLHPAVLFVGHPERKRRSELDLWVAKAAELLGSATLIANRKE